MSVVEQDVTVLCDSGAVSSSRERTARASWPWRVRLVTGRSCSSAFTPTFAAKVTATGQRDPVRS